MGKTVFDKIWESHSALRYDDGSELVYVDRIFLHERTGGIALKSLAAADRCVRNPAQAFATMDHIIDTYPGRGDQTEMPGGEAFIKTMRQTANDAGITLFDHDDARHGISHLIAAEQGIALPGLVVSCPDSHTCTLGALGAIGWGVGTSDCEHALATETLRAVKPKQMRVVFDGRPAKGVTAKDLILALIARKGAAGGKGYAVEFAGSAVREMSMEGRFTLCNMAVEFSAFTGIVAPDSLTIDYVKGRPYAPGDDAWLDTTRHWQQLNSDSDAVFDEEIHIDVTQIRPEISWGTSPEHSIAVDERIPGVDSNNEERNGALRAALDYMGLQEGQSLVGVPIDGAFIGSCTNARLSDLRDAAAILAGHRVAEGVRAICTPGSRAVKLAAEDEGIDKVFKSAGFEWREPGCSLCFFAGGEGFLENERVISSTNRNFRGRQGRGVRTHLASPSSVAAAAVKGHITDVREFE